MLMGYLGVFFSFLWCISLDAQGLHEDVIVVSAAHCGNEHLFFSYQDYFNDGVTSHSIRQNGDWRVIRSAEPLLIIFSRDWKLYPVYAMPGDTIRTKCTESSHLEFYGNRNNIDLNALSVIENEIGFLLPSLAGIQISEKLDFDYLSGTFDSLQNARLKILQTMYNKVGENAPAAFVQMMSYTLSTDYLRPFVREFDGFSPSKTPAKYVERCDAVITFANVDSMIFNRNYRSFIFTYNQFLARDSVSKYGKSHALYNTAKKAFTGQTRDYLLFQLVKTDLIGESRLVQDFRETCKNKRYVAYIDSLIAKNKELNSNRDLLQDTLLQPDGVALSFAEFLRSHHGRPVYIDFWASWCKPSIAEFGPLKEFERQYKSKIDFVSISIDDDPNKWLKAIAKYSLGSSNQLLTTRESLLAAYLNLQGIPRFVMIDKKGQAISLDAPRPTQSMELVVSSF